MITKEKIYNKLKKVLDPELKVNVVDLGLIYDVSLKGKEVNILMTLTFPGCPFGPKIHDEINEKVKELREIEKVNVDITFSPPWDLSKVSDEAKARLGII